MDVGSKVRLTKSVMMENGEMAGAGRVGIIVRRVRIAGAPPWRVALPGPERHWNNSENDTYRGVALCHSGELEVVDAR